MGTSHSFKRQVDKCVCIVVVFSSNSAVVLYLCHIELIYSFDRGRVV